LTERGLLLAKAVEHKIEEDTKREWSSIVSGSPAAGGLIQMIKVNQPVPKEQMSKRIASYVGAPASAQTTTGANCLADILQEAGIIKESDGTYVLVEVTEEPKRPEEPATKPAVKPEEEESALRPKDLTPGQPAHDLPAVHIDIQIHVSADAKAEQIDQVFASMAKHLYGKK
jgi:hypothetical protein